MFILVDLWGTQAGGHCMRAPVLASGGRATAWGDGHAAIEHGHFSAIDGGHQMHFIHVTKVPNAKQLASDFGQTTAE
jgi:hypothetical protein